jgi:hypothetical protein
MTTDEQPPGLLTHPSGPGTKPLAEIVARYLSCAYNAEMLLSHLIRYAPTNVQDQGGDK